MPLFVTKYSMRRVNHGLQRVSPPPNDQRREGNRQQLGLSLWFLLGSWAARSVRLPDTQSASRSTSLCTNLQANKTRYQRMTRTTSPPGIFLLLLLLPLFFLLPPPLWTKCISELHFSLFAAMLEARWRVQYKRNIPVISRKSLRWNCSLRGGNATSLFFSFPSVYLTRQKKKEQIYPPPLHTQTHTALLRNGWRAGKKCTLTISPSLRRLDARNERCFFWEIFYRRCQGLRKKRLQDTAVSPSIKKP